jgi:hypothetical protein
MLGGVGMGASDEGFNFDEGHLTAVSEDYAAEFVSVVRDCVELSVGVILLICQQWLGAFL